MIINECAIEILEEMKQGFEDFSQGKKSDKIVQR
jgi:hypothetical protein